MMQAALQLLLGATLIAGPPSHRPDDMILKDGRVIEDVRIEKAKGGYRIRYEHGDVFVPESLVQDVLILRDDGFQPRNEEEKVKAAKGLVPFEGRWVKKARREQLVKKRQDANRARLEELKSHRKWRNRYITKTKNFQFEYTIDPGFFKDLSNLMETYYKVFTKEWKIRRPSRLGRLKVCFYHDYEKFLQVGGAGRGVLGYYRFVPPLELNFYFDRSDPELTREVMFHEANHYLTHLIDLEFHYPHNINEAMAEYYGASRWDSKKKKMSTGHLLEGRLTEVLTDIQGGDMRSLEDFLTNKLGYHDYSWGWSFVHFMMETKKYRRKWKAFYLSLARDKGVKRVKHGQGMTVEGDEILRVFKKKMRIKDISALEEEWHAYIKANLKIQSHRGYEKAAVAAMGTGQTIKARRFFKQAVEKGSRNPKILRRYARLLAGDGKRDQAANILRKALEHDPLDAETYAELGKLLRRNSGKKDKQEGKRLLLLARDIDPDNVSLLLDEALQDLFKDDKGAKGGSGKPDGD